MKKLESKLCIINYSDSLAKLANETVSLIEKKIIEYEEFLEISCDKPIIVNYFDNIRDFREFIYEIRGERSSLPEYATGTYDKEMVNAYINPKNQLERIYTASHELFHILYMKYILKDDYSKRIVWYDEGMAQFMSGEKDYLKEGNNFEQYFLKVRETTKEIPNINKIKHGSSFCNKEYNGYDLSYLVVRYLSEIMELKDFKNLMSNFTMIKKIGNNIIEKAFEYYSNQKNLKR